MNKYADERKMRRMLPDQPVRMTGRGPVNGPPRNVRTIGAIDPEDRSPGLVERVDHLPEQKDAVSKQSGAIGATYEMIAEANQRTGADHRKTAARIEKIDLDSTRICESITPQTIRT